MEPPNRSFLTPEGFLPQSLLSPLASKYLMSPLSLVSEVHFWDPESSPNRPKVAPEHPMSTREGAARAPGGPECRIKIMFFYPCGTQRASHALSRPPRGPLRAPQDPPGSRSAPLLDPGGRLGGLRRTPEAPWNPLGSLWGPPRTPWSGQTEPLP